MCPALSRRWRLPLASWTLVAMLSASVLLASCASHPALPAAGPAAVRPSATEVVVPNAQLVVQGIPPVPQTLAREVARYTDFRGHAFLDWHPTRREMLVSHRPADGSTAQLFRLAAPLAAPERLTDFTDPVTTASYDPQAGRYIVFERASGGNEVVQLYRLDLESRAVTLLTDPDQRHNFETWVHGTAVAGQPRPPARLLHLSVPLDRTAAEGSRAQVQTQLWLLDPLQPQGRRLVAELPGSGWAAHAVSHDDRQVALTRYLSATRAEVWLLDLADGQRRLLLPAAGQAPAFHLAAAFSPDDRALMVLTDRAGEFKELQRYELAGGQFQRVTGHIPWDVDGGDASADGRLLALRSNEDGRGQMRLFDASTLTERAVPAALPNGSVSRTRFHPQRGELAFMVNGAAGPGQIHSLDLASGQLTDWTRPLAAPGVDPQAFAGQQLVRWPSFDGRSISGLLTLPPARFTGKRPVLINIHGGPEGQASFGFLGRWHYLVEELGVAYLQPNVRGSSGYGKTFLGLDNGVLREDSVKDIGALLDWIATQPHLDPNRVVVMGGSYGGYMSLAVSTHYADRIAGAIDVVGISHFITFLNNTESYRRDLRRVEYGDERDPVMREVLERISPLSNAHKIRRPLLVVQGRNDPRVPWTEAEQIVERARANGTPVWYLRADNEGHGFVRKENADFQLYATVLFLRETLLK